MEYYSSYISKLIEELSKLPGVGTKSADGSGNLSDLCKSGA